MIVVFPDHTHLLFLVRNMPNNAELVGFLGVSLNLCDGSFRGLGCLRAGWAAYVC